MGPWVLIVWLFAAGDRFAWERTPGLTDRRRDFPKTGGQDDHDLKHFLKLHARDGAATGPLCARALKRIEVLEAALTPFALFSQRAKDDDEPVLHWSDFDHARCANRALVYGVGDVFYKLTHWQAREANAEVLGTVNGHGSILVFWRAYNKAACTSVDALVCCWDARMG